jgi:hypothetical protein
MAQAGEGRWTVVLRCHECGVRFTISRLSIERIPLLPQIVPCPQCSAQSVVSKSPSKDPKKLHRILDVRRDDK